MKLPKNQLFRSYLLIFITYLIWGAAGPVIKLTLDYIPVFSFLLIRFIIVCGLLLPYLFIQLKKHHIHPEDLLKITILGVFSQSSLALIFFGFKYTSALEATVIGVLGPILAVYAGHHFYNEKVSTKVKVGLLVASVGTLFVAIEPILNFDGSGIPASQRLLGNFFVILYTLAFLLYMLWSKMVLGQNKKPMLKTLKLLHIKPMRKVYSSTLITTLTFYVGLLTFIPFAILENFGVFGDQVFLLSNLTTVPILGILFMALISSLIAYTFFEKGLEKVDVKDTAIFSYLQPLLTAPFAYLLLSEVPTTPILIGGAIIAIGVGIAELRK